MKLRRSILQLACGLLMLCPTAIYAAGGITGTDHDFTQAMYTNNAVGLCTFCHTPHKAQTTSLLWNHMDSGNSYGWNDIDQTAAGTKLPTFSFTWNGPSPKCLSCHDGTISIGDVAWFKEGATTVSITGSAEGTILTGGVITDSTHVITNGGAGGGGAGSMNGNHPVVIPYPTVSGGTYNGVTTGAGIVTSEWVPDPVTNQIVLYKTTLTGGGKSVVRRITDPTEALSGNVGIECSSCHDPHNGATTGSEYFLRGALTGSTVAADSTGYICKKCHNK